mmetsp:Transcript_37375/g.80986  ORF Transcript_37375/g.80986 Transcript_37375/m.80986 type:complete len:289 (-) Transcript_37375:64-930(-)
MPKFDPAQVWSRWADTTQRPISIFMAVPTMYARLISAYNEHQDQNLLTSAARALRLMVSGSSALPSSVFRRWELISGHRLLERYGMTEIGMALSNPLDPNERREGLVGAPLPGVSARIVLDGVDVTGTDTPGDLQIKGDTVFREYWNRQEATAEAFDEDGWFHTGDVASSSADNRFAILGRSSVDIIKTAGFKVSALDIEREFLEHEGVDEVAVLGLADDEYGEKVAALVVPRDGTDPESLTVAALREWGAHRLAKYKLPAVVKVVEALPRNAMGKLNKVSLRATFFP